MARKFSDILILSDIDGTFLGKNSRMVERNLAAIEYFKAEGGLFTFNTGRSCDNLFLVVPNAAELANAPIALSNGCCFYDQKSKRSITDYFMPSGPAFDFTKYVSNNHKDVGLRVSRKTGFLADPQDTIAVENLRAMKVSNFTLAPIDTWRSDDWYKVALIGDFDRLSELRSELKLVFGETFAYEKSGWDLLEIHRPDRSKAAMIDTYRAYFAGRELRIFAVGDFENDYEMLLKADVAACPSNAIESIKEICDIQLCSNDEGAIADLVGQIVSTG